MGLNVGVSLWTTQQDSATPPLRQNKPQEQTFAQKAGVQPAQPKADEALPQSNTHQWQLSGLSSTQQHPQTIINQIAQKPETGLLELYGLGLRAGSHLSYVPQFFWASVQSERQTPMPVVDDGKCQVAVAPQVQEQRSWASDDGYSDQMPPHLVSEVLVDSRNELSDTTPMLTYLMRKWPERHVQILPRGKGIEVIIRDYHLSLDEQLTLVQDLTRQAGRPETIWINGQSVWQAPSFSSQSTGNSHGH